MSSIAVKQLARRPSQLHRQVIVSTSRQLHISTSLSLPAHAAQRAPKHSSDVFKARQQEQPGTRGVDDFSLPLGTRSQRPPDGNEPTEPEDREPQIPDQDWEIRTGRAIYVLQQTLPEFFSTGLITSVDKSTGSPQPPRSTGIPIVNVNPLDPQVPENEDVEMIYSPKVTLAYTPPTALPAPFPSTLHVEGLPLYLASSSFVRHTLNALYSDVNLTLTKFVVHTPPKPVNASEEPQSPHAKRRQSKISREKRLELGYCVTGISRVSKAPGEWEVLSTYSFSPSTGLINRHVVNSIYPAPTQAVYDSLRLSLGKMFGYGLGEDPTIPRANGAACTAPVPAPVGRQHPGPGLKGKS